MKMTTGSAAALSCEIQVPFTPATVSSSTATPGGMRISRAVIASDRRRNLTRRSIGAVAIRP